MASGIAGPSLAPCPTEEVAVSVMDDAQVLWDYHQLNHEPRNTDIAIGLGSHDIGVAEHAAALYHQGRFPLIIFSGANAPTTVDAFPRGEAVHYAQHAEQLGVPSEAVLIEPHATNTSTNFVLTKSLLARAGIHPRSATVISRPYQQRRAFTTSKKVWPELFVVCSSTAQSLQEYISGIGNRDLVINMLVGDTERIWTYARRGYAIHQKVPRKVADAFGRLEAAGFDGRLTDEWKTRKRQLEDRRERPHVPRIAPQAPRQFSVSGIEVDYFVRVICTDRGQHDCVLLTTARRDLDGTHGMSHALRWFAPPGPYEYDSRVSHNSYEFSCPRCDRRPRITRESWWSLVDETWRVGFSELDVSRTTLEVRTSPPLGDRRGYFLPVLWRFAAAR